MLRAGINDPNHPLIVCGLSDGNIQRLRAGQPIKAPLRSFGVDLPGHLCIIHGATEADMEREFRAAGLIGDGTRVTVDPKIDQEFEARARHERILIATVGLPRSGKSTWARSQTHPTVNPDAIRLAITGQRYVALAEPFVWATAKAMTRALFGAGHKTVILDATNMSRKRRDEWQSKEWGTFFKLFCESALTCKERATATGREDLIPVIDRMAGESEPLGADEQLWP
jgi:predicted kinase